MADRSMAENQCRSVCMHEHAVEDENTTAKYLEGKTAWGARSHFV